MRLKSNTWWPWAAGLCLLASTASAEPKNLKALVLGTSPHEVLRAVQQNGHTEKLSGGVLLTTQPDTAVKKAGMTSLSLGAGRKTPAHVYHVSAGRLDIKIPESSYGEIAVLVVGPQGESAVISGGHAIAVVNDGHISFSAARHELLTGKGSRWRKLSPGSTRSIDLRRGRTAEWGQMPAPELAVAQRLVVALPDAGFTAKVNLKPVPRAQRYQVALMRQDGAKLTLVSHTITKAATAELNGAAPGTYLVFARGIDSDGVEGELSAPTTIRVLGIELPPGARATNGQVLLPPSQRLPLQEVDGLKMTYGNGTYFVDAPKSVGLTRGERTTVRFKEPSTNEEVRLTLAPQVVKAAVEIGPKTAHWPKDDISVKVSLTDGSGAPLKDDNNVTIDVSVNLEPVAMKWKKTGTGVQGSIKPRAGKSGPWVVRVEVKNELGRVVGRDFLEVVANEPPKAPASK